MDWLMSDKILMGRQKKSSVVSLHDQICHDLYHEKYFNEMLCLERKRAERSGTPFLLMLLHLKELCNDGHYPGIVKRIATTLKSAARETDLKGWYQFHSVLGIIFTELNGIDKRFLKKKIYDHLCNNLGNDTIDKIHISLHMYPEKKNDDSDSSSDLTIYPDFTDKKLPQKTAHLIKRTIDVIGGLCGILIFSPFFIIVPCCIKLTSKGPVFFKQERLGQFGKKFVFLKFRSMYVNTNPDIHKVYIQKFICENKEYDGAGEAGAAKPVFKIKNDPRITPIGKFLRKTSLDELPQFFNVLRGEMSLVGPRPPIPYEIDNYDVWHKRRVTEIKPGITGLWQVEGRSSTSFDEMVRLDLQYLREWSIWLDIKILLKTPKVVLTGRGAY